MSSLEILQQDFNHNVGLIINDEETLRKVNSYIVQILPVSGVKTASVSPRRKRRYGNWPTMSDEELEKALEGTATGRVEDHVEPTDEQWDYIFKNIGNGKVCSSVVKWLEV